MSDRLANLTSSDVRSGGGSGGGGRIRINFDDRAQLALALLIAIGGLLIPAISGQPYWLHIAQLCCLFAAAAVFQNFLISDANQVSFGQGAVFGVAAYTVGIACGLNGLSPLVGAVLGISAALVLGLIFAGPSLRVQGYYLGFVTIAAAIVFPEMLIAFNKVTNGVIGIRVDSGFLRGPVVGRVDILTLLVLAITMLSFTAHYFVRRTRIGRMIVVAGISPEAAASLGFRPGVMRFAAFLIAAFFTGLAGIAYVPVVEFVSPHAFAFELSALLFFSVIIGGQRQLIAPALGVLVLYIVPNVLLVDFLQFRLIIYGLIALAVMLLFPDGVVGSFRKLANTGVSVALLDFTKLGKAVEQSLHRSQDLAVVTGQELAAASGEEIEVRQVSKRYGTVAALDDVSVKVERGKVHGLVGPNGSGKTTLLNAISGFVKPDSGTVLVKGRPIGGRSVSQISLMGVARTFQTPRVFEPLSIGDNLKLGFDAKIVAGRGQSVADDRIEVAWLESMPERLSHGQRRLVELFRVVLSEPSILLLDEPAAGLSPQERKELAEIIGRLSSEFGRTVLLVEHDLSLVWSVADQISVLETGRVIAEGTPEELRSNPRVIGLFTGDVDKGGPA